MVGRWVKKSQQTYSKRHRSIFGTSNERIVSLFNKSLSEVLLEPFSDFKPLQEHLNIIDFTIEVNRITINLQYCTKKRLFH